MSASSIGRKMSVPTIEREFKLHEKDIEETLHDTALQHTQMKMVEKKDFTNEVRGTRDINNFLEKSEVLLDLNEFMLEGIVERLLDEMMQEKYGESVTRDELMSLIFCNPERTLLSECIQGTISRGKDQYDWEQVETQLRATA